jgi:hypothetical protein
MGIEIAQDNCLLAAGGASGQMQPPTVFIESDPGLMQVGAPQSRETPAQADQGAVPRQDFPPGVLL